MRIRKNEDNIELIKKIKAIIIKNKSNLIKAFELDNKEWKYKVEFDDVIKVIDEKINEKTYLKFNKKEIISGIGDIALINTTLFPLVNLNVILSSIRTNNNITVFLENKFLASNRILIEIISEALDDDEILKYQIINKKEDFYKFEKDFDKVIYIGNGNEYINFSNRLNIESCFENYGEIFIYLDKEIEEYNNIITNMDKYAYANEINIYYLDYETDKFKNYLNSSLMKNIVVIFSKNIENVYKLINEIKSENIFINLNPFEKNMYRFNIDEKKLLYVKKIII